MFVFARLWEKGPPLEPCGDHVACPGDEKELSGLQERLYCGAAVVSRAERTSLPPPVCRPLLQPVSAVELGVSVLVLESMPKSVPKKEARSNGKKQESQRCEEERCFFCLSKGQETVEIQCSFLFSFFAYLCSDLLIGACS